MGIIIGAGVSRPIHPNHLLSLGEFSETKVYNAGDFVIYQNKIYRFTTSHAAGPWDSSEVKQSSSLDIIVSAVGDPRIKPISANNVSEGDMLFYDRLLSCYCIVRKAAIAAVLADYNHQRYETNYDTLVGVTDNVAHFTAITDAYSQSGMFTGEGDTAASNTYYRIEIDNTQNGNIKFYSVAGEASWAIGSASSPAEVEWSAGESMTDIVAKFVALNKSYNVFGALADGKGVGLKVGGYGTNLLTVTESSNCTVLDCSGLSFLRSQNPAAPAVGGDFNPNAAWTYLNKGEHLSFRGSTARTILSSAYPSIVTSSTSALGMSGINYSYRCGLNFAKFKSWASGSGEDSFTSDGVNGSSSSSAAGHVMKESRFEAEIVSGATGDKGKMFEYYDHLLNDQTGDYATLRQSYEAKYGQMTSMYDAYLMSHMADPGANSGIVSMMRNNGFDQTHAKADLMTVTYDMTIIPAYPPEYNACQYGIADSEGFAPGRYYHPEPADLALRYRDDIMALVNANVDTVNGISAGTGSTLSASSSRGSCADYYAGYTWCLNGTYGTLYSTYRYPGRFRCRPSLALPLPI